MHIYYIGSREYRKRKIERTEWERKVERKRERKLKINRHSHGQSCIRKRNVKTGKQERERKKGEIPPSQKHWQRLRRKKRKLEHGNKEEKKERKKERKRESRENKGKEAKGRR